jgi:hypothetical protein
MSAVMTFLLTLQTVFANCRINNEPEVLAKGYRGLIGYLYSSDGFTLEK